MRTHLYARSTPAILAQWYLKEEFKGICRMQDGADNAAHSLRSALSIPPVDLVVAGEAKVWGARMDEPLGVWWEI